MLAAKIDLLMKRLEERTQEKQTNTVQAMDSHMTCEVCGNVGHSENDCPKTREDAAYINNRFRQGGNSGWNNQQRPPFHGGNSNSNSNYNSNQQFLKDLVLGQAKINESLTKKLLSNDKMLKNINSKIESLSFPVQNQMRFNKMIETQLAQITVAIPINHSRKIPRQLENSPEHTRVSTGQ